MEVYGVMRPSMLLLLALACASFVDGTVSDMGKCIPLKCLDDFDFDEYATTNGGHWKYQLVPNLTFFEPIKYAGVIYKPTGTKGVYDVTIYNILHSGETETFSNGQITYLGNGHAINNATETGEGNIIFKYCFLEYKPCEFMFYYVCTEDGGDITTDYRNGIVTHEQCDDVTNELIAKDKQRCLKNGLMQLNVEE